MGCWLELRCDSMEGEGCVSGRNEGPMRMAPHRTDLIQSTLRRMYEEARQQGWTRKRIDGGYRWFCPACTTHWTA